MTGIRRIAPIFGWLPHYDRRWLLADTIAGLTVWALVVPEAIAYAGIAGVPVQYGLYTVPLALAGYIVFGSSRRLFVGPSATVATISATAVASVAAANAPRAEFVALTASLALLVGAIYIVLGLLRMGFIARFFARPVLAGFIIGLGIFIAVGQAPKLVGIEKPAGDTVAVFVSTLAHVADWQWTTVAVGVAALVALFALSRFAPKAPGALAVVVLAVIAAKILDLGSHGVALVGDVPTGFSFTSWSGVSARDLLDLLPGAFAIVIVGFAQSIAIAKAYATEEHARVDANQEMIGYGAANLGAGALQGFTVTGSLSKSAAAEKAGGRSPVLLAVAGVAVVLTILVLAGLFEDVPETVLAAVVIHAVWGMTSAKPLAQLWRSGVAEVWLALGALVGVLVIGILPGVLIGVALSFILLIRRLDHPHIASVQHGTTLVYTWAAPLVFANSEVFSADVLSRVRAADPQPATVVIDSSGISQIDTTGSAELRELKETLDGLGVRMLLVRPNEAVVNFLDANDVLGDLGLDAIHPTIHEAVEAGEALPIRQSLREAAGSRG